MSPRRVLRHRTAHCMEGALFAASALWLRGEKPMLMDLRAAGHDYDHVVALFRRHGRWGAISKTNHAVLRYREPVYRTLGELALSYFHEYFLDDGTKTLRSYSRPFHLSRIRAGAWVTAEDELWDIPELLDASAHADIVTRPILSGLRRAGSLEIEAGKLTEY